jgi:hypothetical protein
MSAKNFFIQVLSNLVLAGLFQFFLPWWTVVIPCAAIAFFYGHSGKSSFLTGFLSTALLWIGLALWISGGTQSALPAQISNLFPGKSDVVLFMLTGLTGGLTGGFASLTGYLFRRLI